MNDVKRIDIAEFRRLGFVQEINRLVLHPCGLALEVTISDDGVERLGGVWDYRDDPEGIYYEDLDLQPKAASVAGVLEDHAAARLAKLGYVVQPAGA